MAGNYASAEADLARVVAADPKDAFHALWLSLGRMKAGRDGLTRLAAAARGFEQSQWPMPIVSLFLGTGSPGDFPPIEEAETMPAVLTR
jgi:lipoprotein NlpI